MSGSSINRTNWHPHALYYAYRAIFPGVRLLTRLLLAVRLIGGENLPRNGPVLVVANHLNYFDILLLLIFLPRPPIFLAKEEVTSTRFVGWVTRLSAVSLRRGQSDRRAIRRSLAVLDDGHVLLVFPEGTRSRRPGLLRGLPGVGLLARRSGAMLVTAAITGTEKLTLRSFFRLGLTLTIGSPVTLDELLPNGSQASAAEITEALMQRLAALLPPEYRGHYAAATRAGADRGAAARQVKD